MIEDINILDRFTLEFVEIIEKFSEYIIVSGFVAISSGRTRGTEDIDMIIRALTFQKFSELHDELLKNGFICMQSDSKKEIFEYLSEFNPVRYNWKDKPLPQMELKFAKDILDDYQIKTKTKLDLTGLDVWFSNVNVNIAFKEHLLKSPKDIEDAKHLRIVYEEKVSEHEIKKVTELIDRCRP